MDTNKTELIETLKVFISDYRLRHKYVEQSLGMPRNSLSNFLSFKKILPDKWILPIEKLCAGEDIITFGKNWALEIEAYCLTEGISPVDLINTYKQWKQVRNQPPVAPKSIILDTILDTKKPYNPNNNPVYKKKMGL